MEKFRSSFCQTNLVEPQTTDVYFKYSAVKESTAGAIMTGNTHGSSVVMTDKLNNIDTRLCYCSIILKWLFSQYAWIFIIVLSCVMR